MRRFWSDNHGNVAVLFAFVAIPLLGAVGAAVDYSMASSYRTDIQKAIDATALALSKIMPASETVLNEQANQYFKANMGEENLAQLEPWSVTVTPGDGTVTIAAKGLYKPSLVRVLGIDNFEISAQAIAKWNLGKVEVVLALDNTGSMSGQKIAKLKEGAQKLVDILKSAAKKEGDAKIAIVPFAVQVKVDANTYRSATWHDTGYCSKSQYKTETACQKNKGTWSNVSAASWGGCIADREQKDSSNSWINYDVLDTEPVSTNHDTKFPRASTDSNKCPAATILPLTDVYLQSGYDTITNKITQMQAQGNTNVTIGAVWGWHMLDDKSPFSEGKPYQTKDLQKYLILMTDGDNTQNRFTTSESSINARTQVVCNNIKALPQNTANSPATPAIKVWTIRLINGNETLLKNCATEASMYISVTDANQLTAVFTAIGSEIASLHLAK